MTYPNNNSNNKANKIKRAERIIATTTTTILCIRDRGKFRPIINESSNKRVDCVYVCCIYVPTSYVSKRELLLLLVSFQSHCCYLTTQPDKHRICMCINVQPLIWVIRRRGSREIFNHKCGRYEYSWNIQIIIPFAQSIYFLLEPTYSDTLGCLCTYVCT